MGFIIKEVKDCPLFFIQTNIIESINSFIKKCLMKKKWCQNWLYIVKKIICLIFNWEQRINKRKKDKKINTFI